jgi:hypothetical protein
MSMLDTRSGGEWSGGARGSPGPGFKREPLPLPHGNSFLRLMTARVISQVTRTTMIDVIANMWPSDRIVARAATAPAMTTVPGWAAELAQRIVTDALTALGPVSAAAQLLKLGLVLSFDRHAIINAPGFTAAGGSAGFVQEGMPIPVRQLAAVGAQLLPYKLAAIAVLTREMVESSNAEQMIGDVLIRSEGIALDAALFDNNPATAARPAGLRNGITALTASANTDAFGAFFEDISTVVNSVAPVGGPIVLITSAGRAASMESRPLGGAGSIIRVLATTAVGNDMVAVAPAGVVAAFSPDPEIETANAGTLHMSDAPGQIVNGGAPAAPQKSLMQTDSIALKTRWPMSWALRSPLACAWLTPTWK